MAARLGRAAGHRRGVLKTLLAGVLAGTALASAGAGAANADAAAAGAGAAGAAAATCGAGLDAGSRRIVRAESLRIAYAPRPAPLPLGRHFALHIELCGGGTLERIDADMPAHRHGMNYRPTLRCTAPTHCEAQGLLFHMPGRWRLSFEIDRRGERVTVSDEFELE